MAEGRNRDWDPRVIAMGAAVWTALSAVSVFLLWLAYLSYNQGDWGTMIFIIVLAYLVIAPPKYDPFIRLREFREKRRR